MESIATEETQRSSRAPVPERAQRERARRPKRSGTFSGSANSRVHRAVHKAPRPFPHPRGASCRRQAASTDKGESTAPEAKPRSRCKGASRVTKHIYAGGERLASKMHAAWFSERPIQYYVSDHLGSAHYTLDGHQNLLSHTEFFPSGELWIDQLNQNYTQTPRWLFTGKEWDADTQLYDFGARQYDPRVGQWLSPDPILRSYMGGSPSSGVYRPANLALYGEQRIAMRLAVRANSEMRLISLSFVARIAQEGKRNLNGALTQSPLLGGRELPRRREPLNEAGAGCQGKA